MEMIYQYLWQHALFGRELRLTDGRALKIIAPGLLNRNAGPDFFNARLNIEGETWAGNVEIHVKASDWKAHGHDSDTSYDSVVLHAVGTEDCKVTRTDGSPIPCVELPISIEFGKRWASLCEENGDLRCRDWLAEIPRITRTDWLETLAVERLHQKAGRLADTLTALGGDWEQTCFAGLARALGFNLNSDPLEQLARNLPLRILHHHSDNPMQIEALLLGQAGRLFTETTIPDSYFMLLQQEYKFLAHKYSLKPMDPKVWKLARTRPQNFPDRRIALLARACVGGFALMGKLLSTRADADAMRELFRWRLGGYWETHYAVGRPSENVATGISDASLDLLLINFVAPMLTLHGLMQGNTDAADKAMSLLESIAPEKNAITRAWKSAGITADSALRSQALIHLRREYCDRRRCAECRFGHKVLTNSTEPHSCTQSL